MFGTMRVGVVVAMIVAVLMVLMIVRTVGRHHVTRQIVLVIVFVGVDGELAGARPE